MITTEEMILIAGMTVVTFVARYPLLVLVGRIQLPERIFRALRFVPVAVLTAITLPAVLMPKGTVDVSTNNAYLYGSVAAIIISWRTKNLLLTIIGGMICFVVWRVLFGN